MWNAGQAASRLHDLGTVPAGPLSKQVVLREGRERLAVPQVEGRRLAVVEPHAYQPRHSGRAFLILVDG